MKKRILAFMIALCMAITVVGCGNGEISNDKIRIKQYKGLEVEEIVYEVTDADVESSIQSTLATMPITDRPAENGDNVIIDFVGKIDGVEFEDGSATGAPLTLGSGTFIPGFEEGVIGHNVGETFDINVTFPEDYKNADVAGKAAVFTITLQSNVPEFTEELLPQLSQTAKTLDEYREEVREDLEISNNATAEESMIQEVWSKLIENCVVDKYPEDEIAAFVTSVDTQFAELAEENEMEPAEIFQYWYGATPEEYIKNVYKMQYAIELIAEKEKLTVTVEEYDKALAEYAAQENRTDLEAFEEEVGRESIETSILQGKVQEILVENWKIVQPEETEE